MAENKNIYEKLAEVRKAVEVVQKDSTGYGYNYVSDRELLALISGTMEANHLTLIPRIPPWNNQGRAMDVHQEQAPPENEGA